MARRDKKDAMLVRTHLQGERWHDAVDFSCGHVVWTNIHYNVIIKGQAWALSGDGVVMCLSAGIRCMGGWGRDGSFRCLSFRFVGSRDSLFSLRWCGG